jgi:hypothetical protein
VGRRRLVIRVVLAVAVVAVVYVGLLPKLVDLGQVGATLRAMTWLELATLLAAAVWNLVSYLLPQLAALPGPRFGQAVLESHASTAVLNLLPAGQLALAAVLVFRVPTFVLPIHIGALTGWLWRLGAWYRLSVRQPA